MRAIVVLLLLAVAIAGGGFFASHPGQVEIVWQGWQIDTSVGLLVAAAALLALLTALLALAIAALRRLPRNLRRWRAARRRRRGERELTGGIVALAAGQAGEALAHARHARQLLDDAPMALLLSGEAAHRQGDAASAHQAYAMLLERRDTEFLGLRGLIGEALRDGDDSTALRLAERARLLRPEARWLAENLLVLQARGGQWQAARDLLAGAARRGALTPERAHHHRGVVLHELSLAAEHRGELRQAASLAGKAQALAPDLAALACQHARLLLALGRRRAATKAIKCAWRTAPHPDLARLYLELRPEAGPLARVASLQRLAAQNPEAAESRLAIAEAALAARLWGEARRHLELAAGSPPAGASRRLCLLWAQLEDGSGNPQAAHDWREQAVGAMPGPGYVCRQCGGDNASWQPLCSNCGSFDTLAWQSRQSASGALRDGPATPLLLPAPDVPSSRLARASQSDN